MVSTTFKISKASNITVGFLTDFQNFTNLRSTTIILGYVYMGYVLKIPIFTCDQADNGWGLALTLGGFIASNIAGYQYLKSVQAKKPLLQGSLYLMAMGYYQTNYDRLVQWVRDNKLFLDTNISLETKCNGLIILEAYFGLEEHIYQIDAGLLIFKRPTTIEEYYEC